MKNKKSNNTLTKECPCGSGLALIDCCAKYHANYNAPDAVSLMRSRYSAYVLGLETYLLATWHKSTRPNTIDINPAIKWINLKILITSKQNNQATVEFIAYYKINGRANKMHEISHFIFKNGHWFYLYGEIQDK
jgi:SEC-C motif domain protein